MAGKLVTSGLALLFVNTVVVGIIATSAVDIAVKANFKEYPIDTICANEDCTLTKESWEISTREQTYYAHTLTNPDDYLNGSLPELERLGPFVYEITTERELIDYNPDSGQLTYRQWTSYQCRYEVSNCSTEITQLNIAFNPQVAGAIPSAISSIIDLTEYGFVNAMIDQDLIAKQASIATAENIVTATTLGGGTFASAGYAAWIATPDGISVQAQNAANLDVLPIADFTDGIDSALHSTYHSLDPNFDISLENENGPIAFMSMGEPDRLVEEIEADITNSSTMKRAIMYDYAKISDYDDGEPIYNVRQTLVRDWALYTAVGGLMLANNGDSDYREALLTQNTLESRFSNLHGGDWSDTDLVKLVLDGDGTSNPKGLVAISEDGTGFGASYFLTRNQSEIMQEFGLSNNEYSTIYSWINNWKTSVTKLPMPLLGKTGELGANDFAVASFGGADPIYGGLLELSLNRGGEHANEGGQNISLSINKTRQILYGEYGLTTAPGINTILYGNSTGQALPIPVIPYLDGMWDSSDIATMYDVDVNTAIAIEKFICQKMFEEFVPGFLLSNFEVSRVITQPLDNWLLGWHDPVLAYLESGNPNDMSVGWTSLESNKTFYSSENIPNGNGTEYTICTGESDSCSTGEILLIDMSPELSWRSAEKEISTYGRVTSEPIVGTSGGFLTEQNNLVNAAGFDVVELEFQGESELKEIRTNYFVANTSPSENPIQAKLVDSGDMLDAIPGLVPIYFSTNISIHTEEISGLIIAGESVSKFFLDTRSQDEMATEPSSADLVVIFEIASGSEISDEDAELMTSSINDNKKILTFWTNFDSIIDFFVFLAHLLSLGMIIIGFTTKQYDSGEEIQEAIQSGLLARSKEI